MRLAGLWGFGGGGERADHDFVALVKGDRRAGRVPVTHGGVVAQVGRGGGRRLRIQPYLHRWRRSGGRSAGAAGAPRRR